MIKDKVEFIYAFIIGGAICVIGQILMDTTKLTPARILVVFVTFGATLGAFGIYDKVIEIGGQEQLYLYLDLEILLLKVQLKQ